MHNDDLGEEMAARENDRHGNAPLRRGPDPDRVAAHLATGEGEKLIAPKAVDGFKTESPIRAFTDFQVAGNYAIGKGFRPSLAHLSRYLDAMDTKEGWALIQVILPRDSDGEPTILFRRANAPAIPSFEDLFPDGVPDMYADLAAHLHATAKTNVATRRIGKHPALAAGYNPRHEDDDFGVEHGRSYLVEDDEGTQLVAHYRTGTWWQGHADEPGKPTVQVEHAVARIVPSTPDLQPVDHVGGSTDVLASLIGADQAAIARGDDPINPKHYGGRFCADIGERLSANGYQILKYVWRCGEKDDPCQEMGKAIWYCDSEVALLKTIRMPIVVKPDTRGLKAEHFDSFLENRIADRPVFVQNIARMLWAGYNRDQLQVIYATLDDHRFHLNCGRGLAL